MREPFFGSSFNDFEKVSALDAYNKIIFILNENSDLSCIMQVHCIFIHRIFDHLEKNSNKKPFSEKIFSNSFFSPENRKRIELAKDVKATTLLGITKHPVFTKILAQSETKHNRAIDKYELAEDTMFYKMAMQKSIPIVCGPSGHTGSLLLGAKLYGKLSSSELQEYALACFAFLTAGGNHSFHEVFNIAALLDIPYEINNYAASMPESIMLTEVYQCLKNQFPQYLEVEPKVKSVMKQVY